jgi:hypothetical protein
VVGVDNRNEIRGFLVSRRARITPEQALSFEALEVAADEGLRISACTAEPGTPARDALNFLASWPATVDQAETARATEGA